VKAARSRSTVHHFFISINVPPKTDIAIQIALHEMDRMVGVRPVGYE
jgi:hypothetical protein